MKKIILTIITVLSLVVISTPSTTSAAPVKHEIARHNYKTILSSRERLLHCRDEQRQTRWILDT
ncbi:hypothetical protein SAMN04487895_101703 [Paenibacillus sophorae]|uniref:Secreted protein n=1 Tax=Paenibacillus sophorae TaxID=1333845 RepID=A0A1H8H1S8_9BACL|nr:hypothetical protein SAMN04487895_101703 [Paenibacillus sophorae]